MIEKIIISIPINRMAAIVTSKGVEFRIENKDKKRTFNENILPVKKIDDALKNSDSFIDLTGSRFGSLTVVGLYDKPWRVKKSSYGLWVVRCVCGNYETRTSRAIKNQLKLNYDDACCLCLKYRKIQKNIMGCK
jgi:hypothetical protein